MKKIIIYIFLISGIWSYGQELNLPVWTQYLADNDWGQAEGGFIHHQDGWLAHQGAANGQHLLLPTGEGFAQLA